MKKIIILLICLIIGLMAGCTKQTTNNSSKITVAVSIVPQETFVKAVAGDTVNVVTMIPPGASPENYGPSTKEMIGLSNSKVYFSIGVPSEQISIIPKLKDFNKDIKIVALADEVVKVYPHLEFKEDVQHDEDEHSEDVQHSHKGYDPHIWLSPKRVKIMIEKIKEELIKLNPENTDVYTKNANEYISRLNDLDSEIKNILSGAEKQSFIIFHPSFGYFADDYGLEMIAIEEDGKQATAKRIQQVVDKAKKENIKFILYSQEFDDSQAKTIASEIGGATIKVAPLSPNYIENLKSLTEILKDVLLNK